MEFQLKGKLPPKTAAERQRLCRARGKGRHRGWRPTRAEVRAFLAPAETPAQEPVAVAAAPSPASTPSSATGEGVTSRS